MLPKILFLSLTLSEDNRDKLTYNFVAKELKGLNELGYEVIHFHPDVQHQVVAGTLYTGKDEMAAISPISTIGFMLKHSDKYLPLLLIDYKKALWLAKQEQAIGLLIERFSIDVVHTHFMFPSGMCAINICKDKNVPIISTMRGAEIYDEPKLSYGAMQCQFFTKAVNMAAKEVQVITAPNKEMQSIACNLFNLSTDKVIYLPNGIENNLLGQFTLPSPLNEKFTLIAIGRFIYRKNYHLLLEVMKVLSGEAIELVLIGEGDLTQDFNDFISENKLTNVKIVNEVPKEQLYQMIYQADCLVHPSYIEGLPNVVIESLAIGKPCIISSIGAHLDVVEEGVNGYYFAPDDSDALITLLKKLVNNRSELQTLAKQCQESAAQFTLSDKLTKYTQLYQSLSKEQVNKK